MTDHHPAPPPSPSVSIYIVDDDEGVRHSLAALLLARGHQAHTFSSGPDCLAQADLAQPGCVLLDLRMDGMSGLQVFEAMRQQGSVLKTVFLSAHGELAPAVAAVKQGAVDWLEKPCDDATLLAAVQRAANRSQEVAQHTQQRGRIQVFGSEGACRQGHRHGREQRRQQGHEVEEFLRAL